MRRMLAAKTELVKSVCALAGHGSLIAVCGFSGSTVVATLTTTAEACDLARWLHAATFTSTEHCELYGAIELSVGIDYGPVGVWSACSVSALVPALSITGHASRVAAWLATRAMARVTLLSGEAHANAGPSVSCSFLSTSQRSGRSIDVFVLSYPRIACGSSKDRVVHTYLHDGVPTSHPSSVHFDDAAITVVGATVSRESTGSMGAADDSSSAPVDWCDEALGDDAGRSVTFRWTWAGWRFDDDTAENAFRLQENGGRYRYIPAILAAIFVVLVSTWTVADGYEAMTTVSWVCAVANVGWLAFITQLCRPQLWHPARAVFLTTVGSNVVMGLAFLMTSSQHERGGSGIVLYVGSYVVIFTTSVLLWLPSALPFVLQFMINAVVLVGGTRLSGWQALPLSPTISRLVIMFVVSTMTAQAHRARHRAAFGALLTAERSADGWASVRTAMEAALRKRLPWAVVTRLLDAAGAWYDQTPNSALDAVPVSPLNPGASIDAGRRGSSTVTLDLDTFLRFRCAAVLAVSICNSAHTNEAVLNEIVAMEKVAAAALGVLPTAAFACGSSTALLLVFPVAAESRAHKVSSTKSDLLHTCEAIAGLTHLSLRFGIGVGPTYGDFVGSDAKREYAVIGPSVDQALHTLRPGTTHVWAALHNIS
jgi:hypothetical protein